MIKLLIVLLMPFSANAAKTFVYCSEASPKIFNPQLATDGATFNAASKTIYNRLVEFKAGTTEVNPALAKKWDISRDGKTYTFHLRKGVKFHSTKYFTPTRDFEAPDVVFSFDRMMNKKNPYHLINGGAYAYFNGMNMGKIIKSVKADGKHKVVFKLSQPEAPFLANMAMDFASILSKEYADKLLKEKKLADLDLKPIGTGAFVYRKYVKDSVVRYKRNENFFRGAPKIENLVISITPDPDVRFQKLKSGECHFIAEPSPNYVSRLEQMKNVKVLKNPGFNVGYLAFNTTKKPFDNAKVRRAIYHALNRDAYIKAIYQGTATKAKNPLPPTIWSYDKKAKDKGYDPALAKKLLKEAGYENGFSTDLWTLPVSRPYNPNGKKMGEMMQADLAKVGIKVKLVTYKWAEYIKRGADGEHSMIQLGWTGDNGDPDNFLHTLLGCQGIEAGSNYARWCNKGFQNLVEQAKLKSKKNTRMNYYTKAQKIFREEVPWVTLAHSTVFKAMSKNVSGYTPNPLGTENFAEVDLK